jgi:hypothetical protein
MQVYTLGKTITTLNSVTGINTRNIYENVLFYNERKPKDYEITGLKINQSTFLNLGLKISNINNCDLSHCVFVDCYFKYSKMINVNFTNCKFINCNFEDVNLISCTFDYASFQECCIDYDKIKASLPKSSNLKWRLCTNMAIESLRLGNDVQFRRFFFAEKEASEEHYLSMFKKDDKYYKNHYSSWQSFQGLLKFFSSKLSKYLWGYGEKISYLVLNMALVITAFAITYYFSGNIFKINGSPELVNLSVIDCFYVSICNFVTITSDITTSNHYVRNLTAIEGFFGVILMGFFVAALFRFINRR